MKRRIDPLTLEFAFLLFLFLAPAGYMVLRWLFGVLGGL